jgi:hypothetical protein
VCGRGAGTLPLGWQTSWSTSEGGESYLDRSEAYSGESILRLHVGAGGGATFVLSDPIAVEPDASYAIECRQRFYFNSETDAAYLSVMQLDSEGREVGFEELVGRKGDSVWSWEGRRLMIRTTPSASTIRIRFGLSAATESYLDVDAVR